MKKAIKLLVSTVLCLAILTTGIALANEHNETLMDRTIQERSEIFAVILAMHGVNTCYPNECFFQGLDDKGNAWWNVKCNGCEDAYCVKLKNDKDGTIIIYNCDSLGGKCFKKLER